MQTNNVAAQPAQTGWQTAGAQQAWKDASTGGWMESLWQAMAQTGEYNDTLMDSVKAAASSATTGEAMQQVVGQMDDVIAASMQNRLAMPEELEEILAQMAKLDKHWEPSTAAEVKADVLERMKDFLSGDKFCFDVDPAVYEKMATNEAFAQRMEDMFDRIANHPWMTADVPGLVSRGVSIDEDGRVMMWVLYKTPDTEEEGKAVQDMLMELLREMEDDMHSVMMEMGEVDLQGRSIEQAMREMAEEYWAGREEETAAA